MDLDKFGGFSAYTWTHEHLVQVLTTGKNQIIKKQNLSTAFKTIKREDFVPEVSKNIANEDRDIEVGYGCTLNKPTIIAQMLTHMEPKWSGKYLDIGTGSGYVAALLAIATGEDGQVYSIDRVQFLVDIARINVAKYKQIKNLQISLKDGADGLKEQEPYDGIHCSFAFESVPEVISSQLKVGGKLVCPTINKDIRIIERVSEKEFKERIEKGYFFDDVKYGIE